MVLKYASMNYAGLTEPGLIQENGANHTVHTVVNGLIRNTFHRTPMLFRQ